MSSMCTELISTARLPRHLGLSLAIIFLLVPTAGAQERAAPADSLRFGERIRITAPMLPDGRVVALYRGITADSLYAYRQPGGPLHLSRAALTGLERRRQDRVRAGLIGASVGSVVGTLGWMLVWCSEGNDTGDVTLDDCLRPSIVYGVPTGVLIGGILGALTGTERWESVSLPR